MKYPTYLAARLAAFERLASSQMEKVTPNKYSLVTLKTSHLSEWNQIATHGSSVAYRNLQLDAT